MEEEDGTEGKPKERGWRGGSCLYANMKSEKEREWKVGRARARNKTLKNW